MFTALKAEWIRISRISYLTTAIGASAAVSVLFTVLTLLTAGKTTNNGPGGPRVSLADLSQTDGSTVGVLSAVDLLGVVALCIFAAAFAADYSSGMLRNLLVRHPRRVSLLAGKFAALTLLCALIVTVAVAAGIVASYLAAPAGVSTAQWLTRAGFASIASAAGDLLMATVGFGLFGAALGILTRKATVAIALGIAWMLPIEQLLSSAMSGAKRWLPGQLLSALAHGGTTSITYATALGVLTIYAGFGVTAALHMFRMRDVTA